MGEFGGARRAIGGDRSPPGDRRQSPSARFHKDRSRPIAAIVPIARLGQIFIKALLNEHSMANGVSPIACDGRESILFRE